MAELTPNPARSPSGVDHLHGPQALYRQGGREPGNPWEIDLAGDVEQWRAMEEACSGQS